MSEKLPYTAPEMEIFGAPDSRRYDLGGKDSVDATAFAYAEKKKPITNAYRFRAMSVEEFATFAVAYSYCPPGVGCLGKPSCNTCWLDWLNSEVEDKTWQREQN